MDRRTLLQYFVGGAGLLVAACGEGGSSASDAIAVVKTPSEVPAPTPTPTPTPTASPAPTLRVQAPQGRRVVPLTTRPTPLASNAIVIDLNQFDPTLPYPGWDGKKPSQASSGKYPIDRDLKVLGHASLKWTGGGNIRGGHHVHWIGGAYIRGPWLRNFTGDACFEGLCTRENYAPYGAESGDSFSINPDPSTLATSKVFVLNCRAENIDGFFDGNHGDCFQLSSHYDAPAGYSSCPAEVTIERFTGTTGYQGLFLPNQHFDAVTNGYRYSCKKVSLIDVNLRKSRLNTYYSSGQVRGRVVLLYLIDTSNVNRGDQPYPKLFRNVYLEPFADEGLDGCIYPASNSTQVDPYIGSRIVPTFSADLRSVTFPASMLVDGAVQLGPPPDGDFARAADAKDVGGLDIPGIGYISPGYL